MFNPKPMDLKDHWSIIGNHSSNAESDLLCCVIYDGMTGKILPNNIVTNKGLQRVQKVIKYVVYIPTDLLLETAYKNVKCDLVTNDELGGTLSQAQNLLNIEHDSNTKPYIQGLPYQQKLMLNEQLSKYLENNTQTALPNETLKDYLRRRAQRDYIQSSYWKTQNLLKLKIDKKKVDDHKSYLIEQKWGKEISTTLNKDFHRWRDELEEDMRHNGSNVKSLIGKINEVIVQDSHYNTTVWGRQLGHFYRVEVDLKQQRSICNCELYNFIGSCSHSKVIELVEFNRFPPLESIDTSGKTWKSIKSHYYKSLVTSIFNGDSNNDLEKASSIHYHACYPEFDPNMINKEDEL